VLQNKHGLAPLINTEMGLGAIITKVVRSLLCAILLNEASASLI